ncbi:MAG: ribonuclease P protein component [bacterium]|nr:ribonuclease P protein component [bacterium]
MSLPAAAGRVASASPSKTDQRFPRSHRLTARRQYLTVYAEGRRVSSASFTLFGMPNDVGACRLGITATRKVGGAVVRNRIKRRLRDVFRRNSWDAAPGIDVVVNARRSLLEREPEELKREFTSAMRRLTRRIEQWRRDRS